MTTQELRRCHTCDGLFPDLNPVGDCPECARDCYGCGRLVTLWSLVDMDGDTYCPGCVAICDWCDEAHPVDDVRTCPDCDQTMCSDWCAGDHEDRCDYRDEDGIHDYGYRPDPIFLGTGPRYMGVELEIDGGDGTGEDARQLLAHSEDEGLFYIKHDSSLDSGLEVVTHPASLEYHMTRMPWDAITRTSREMGYRSHQAGTCGLHVHVSRAALGRNAKAQDLTISRLLVLMWRHWPRLWSFSRRTSDQWCQQQYPGHKVTRHDLDSAKAQGRYTALNLTNRDTVEFRLFRGTLRMGTLKASLQLVDVLVDVARTRSIAWIAKSTWLDIVEMAFHHPELMEYLDTRGLAYGPTDNTTDTSGGTQCA